MDRYELDINRFEFAEILLSCRSLILAQDT
jgi:hypothetical protein